MLLTFVLIGFVNSSCLTRTFEECLSLNVEYQESCQLSQGECRPRPLKCTEIDSTYPQNCKTSECYYSKRFNKCLSQPFTRLLNEIGNRGGQHPQGGSTQGPHQQGPQPTQQGPGMPPQQPPPMHPQQPPQNQSTQTTNQPSPQHNDTQIEDDQEDVNDSEEEEEYDENISDHNEEQSSQNNSTNPINSTYPMNSTDPIYPYDPINSTYPMNSTNSTNNSNNTVSSEFNETYTGYQYLIEEEIKTRLNESDDTKQLEIKSSQGSYLMMAFIAMIISI